MSADHVALDVRLSNSNQTNAPIESNESLSSSRSSSPDVQLEEQRSARYDRAIAALSRINSRRQENPEIEASDMWPYSFKAFSFYCLNYTTFLVGNCCDIMYALPALTRFMFMFCMFFVTIIEHAAIDIGCADFALVSLGVGFVYILMSFMTCMFFCETRAHRTAKFYVGYWTLTSLEIVAFGWAIYRFSIAKREKPIECNNSGFTIVFWLNWMFITGFFYVGHMIIGIKQIYNFIQFTRQARRTFLQRRIAILQPIDFGVLISAPVLDQTGSDDEPSASHSNSNSSSSTISDSTPVCAICSDRLFATTKQTSLPVVSLKCTHEYHVECIQQNIARQRQQGQQRSCPMCSRPIDEKSVNND